jgi:hypothetical protein
MLMRKPRQERNVFIRPGFFMDSNGILLEVVATTREFTADDVCHAAKGATRILEGV